MIEHQKTSFIFVYETKTLQFIQPITLTASYCGSLTEYLFGHTSYKSKKKNVASQNILYLIVRTIELGI